MISFPNAKINIGLNVVEKRPDGFHNLETCFYPIGWKDVLEIVENDKLEFKSFGLAIEGDPKDNLCLKAYELMASDFSLPPVKIVLQKNIPMGGGLGGGSSDAAHTLKLINEKFGLGLGQDRLEGYAEKLGSDCPFFLNNQPSMGFEKGNILKAINLNIKDYHIVVINPGLHVSTPLAYSLVKPQKSERPLEEILLSTPLEEWKSWVKNDFERSVFQAFPAIEELKNTLYAKGAVYAQMSGSGSSVFGIFQEDPKTDWVREKGYAFWAGKM